jgi:paraquat-inducible protein B
MSQSPDKPKIVFFAVVALVVGIVMFLAFGGRTMFSRNESFVLYFDETVNGLGPGSLVKFKGVTIGHVRSVVLNYHQTDTDMRVPVVVDLQIDRLSAPLGVMADLTKPDVLQAEIKRGLRAQLQVESFLAGTMFIDLDFYPNAPAPPPAPVGDLAVMPTIHSDANDAIQTFQDTMAWVPTYDFAAESRKLGDFIDTVSQRVEFIPFAEYSQAIVSSLQTPAGLDPVRWQRGVIGFSGQIDQLQDFLETANREVPAQSQAIEASNESFRQSLVKFNATLTSLRDDLQPNGTIQTNLQGTLGQINAITQILGKRSNAIEEQPSLIEGRPKNPTGQ